MRLRNTRSRNNLGSIRKKYGRGSRMKIRMKRTTVIIDAGFTPSFDGMV